MIDQVLKWGQAIVLVGAVIWGAHTLDVAARESVTAVERTTAVLSEKITTLGNLVDDFRGWARRTLEDHSMRIRHLELETAARTGKAEIGR